MRLTVAVAVAALMIGPRVSAAPIQEDGGTAWTTGPGDVVEIARFPRGSSSPSFTITLEQLDPEGDCPADGWEDCGGYYCKLAVELHRRVVPLANREKKWLDEDIYLLALIHQSNLDEFDGERATQTNGAPLLIGRNNEGLQFLGETVLAFDDEKCFGAAKGMYNRTFKAFYR
jgi:hypothetical protein